MTRRLLAALVLLGALAVGLWFWAGVVAPGYFASIGFGVTWFVFVSVVAGRVGKRVPAVRRVLRGTFLAVVAFTLAAFYWTSIRETRVDERLVLAYACGSQY